jgi:hypothetical protein
MIDEINRLKGLVAMHLDTLGDSIQAESNSQIENTRLLSELLKYKVSAFRYTTSFGTFYTDDQNDVWTEEHVESYTTLYELMSNCRRTNQTD